MAQISKNLLIDKILLELRFIFLLYFVRILICIDFFLFLIEIFLTGLFIELIILDDDITADEDEFIV